MRSKKEQAVSCPHLKSFISKYGHAWILSYFAIYLACFCYLEQTVQKKFHIITYPIDLAIPFCEYFIIPYMLWFVYVAFGVGYFFFRNKQDYYKLCVFLFSGMTVFLFVSAVYPNGHYLRPSEFAHDNWCTKMVEWLYETDTSTNLFPSIHVYNSLGIHIALKRSMCFEHKKISKAASCILCWLIILSTMFLKQHSVFDVLTAFGMAAVMYYFVYSQSYQKVLADIRMGRQKKRHALRLRM